MASDGAQPGQLTVATAHRILEVRVEEATGKNKSSDRVWESDITEGFIKAEVRGRQGSKPTKQVTSTVSVSADTKMTWEQSLYFQITEESSELRLLLCRAKQDSSGKKSTSVVTACGIFISDIVEASPIDKYFEMFKPGSGKEGGFVRLRLNLITEDELRQKQQEASASKSSGKAKAPVVVLVAAAIIAGGIYLFRRQRANRPEKKK